MVQLEYSVGDCVECLSSETMYPSKIIDIKDPESDDPSYLVHFIGWNARYDVLVKHSERSQFLQRGKEGEPASKGKKASKEDQSSSDAASSTRGGASSSSGSVAGPSALPAHKAQQIIIDMPKELRQILINDYDMINRNFYTQVPPEHTVDDIVADYLKTITITQEEMNNLESLFIEYDTTGQKLSNVALICTARGIIDYFNVVLGYQLLYKFERHQYNDLVREETTGKGSKRGGSSTSQEKQFRASAHYGVVHLVRMLAHLPELMKLTQWSDELLTRILTGVHDFMKFLSSNTHIYFQPDQEYQAASSEYFRRSQPLDDEPGPSS